MAEAAGVDMSPTRIFETSEGDRFFGIKRFDRQGNRRLHVHTFGNLIQANFRIPDFADLAGVSDAMRNRIARSLSGRGM
jgi:serine/threonine-protein kinase HipA